MNQVEELFYAQNQPQIQQQALEKVDLDESEHTNFGSCLLKRNSAQSAHVQVKERLNKVTILAKETQYSPKKIEIRMTVKRKETFEIGTPTKNKIDFKSIHKNSPTITYRTVYSSKKSSPPVESISPDSFIKIQRKSESPHRRNLYWQTWLLQPRQHQYISNHSGLIQKTSKIQKEPLPIITAAAYVAMTSDNHQILMQKNENQRRQIASLTKIMTAYTVITICNTFGIKVRQHKITIMQQASFMEGTSANLRVDQEILIIDLLYGLLLPSGNDAGVALAQYFGKFLSFKFAKDDLSNDNRYQTSMERFRSYKDYYDSNYQRESIKLFVFEMNKNAHKIGLKDTHFANPTGLSNSNNFSTAKDLALLTSHCLKNHLLRQIFRKKSYTCIVVNEKLSYQRQVQWKNTNKHLYQFRQCIGAKTGITPTAGPCLSSVYRVMNREIVVIILNCTSIDYRYQDAKNIYRWCRNNIKLR